MSPFSELHDLPRQVTDTHATGVHLLVLTFVFFLTFALVVTTLLGFNSPAGALRLYLVVLLALAAVSLVSKTLSRFGRLERRPHGRKRADVEARIPSFLERAERRLELASATAGQYEQLRKHLREIAEQRLAGHGLRLASEEARRLLGEEGWLLLERPPQGDKFGPGPKPEELERLLGALERI